MNTYKKILILLINLIFGHSLFSQDCGTDYIYYLHKKSHPELQSEVQKFEKTFHSQLNKKADSILIIPVVFHVIHQYGTENISKSKLDNAILQLNLNYRKMNSDTANTRPLFKPYAVDCKIEFRLAKLDPNGNCTEGINRVYSPLTNFAKNNVKSLINWDNSKYLNIWVVKTILRGDGTGILGFAQFPGPAGGPDSTDGVVVIAKELELNNPTLTHEIGHWLGLFHTFSSYYDCNIGDDWVDDTPTQLGDVRYSCSNPPNSCTNFSLPYTSDPPDMYENYMDYSFDICQNMFTIGQKARMDAALSIYRKTIFTKTNLLATGVDGTTPTNCTPVADFQYSSQEACVGALFNFTDKSYNGSGYTTEWTFDKANISSSSLNNPIGIFWDLPGKYLVSLTIANNNGKSTKTIEIIVLPSKAADQMPLNFGFENPDISIDGWIIKDAGLQSSWERTENYSHSGKAALFIRHYSETFPGFAYSFKSKSFNFSSSSKPILSFYVAHADRSKAIFDALRVIYSTDCGVTWYLKKNFTKLELNGNTLPINEDYFPKAGDWHLLELDMSNVNGKGNVQFKFETTNPNLSGNNIFIDDISVQEGSVGINNRFVISNVDFNFIPNPVSNEAHIEFFLPQPATINYLITNSIGQEVLLVENQKLNSGENSLPINADLIQHLAKGVYSITVSINGIKQSKKFVKL
jgi:PKD repeat protein